MPTSYEPTFSEEMRKTFPILRGFENKVRQGIFPIPSQDRKDTLAKRKARKKQAKKSKAKTALHRARTRRNKRERLIWWKHS